MIAKAGVGDESGILWLSFSSLEKQHLKPLGDCSTFEKALLAFTTLLLHCSNLLSGLLGSAQAPVSGRADPQGDRGVQQAVLRLVVQLVRSRERPFPGDG